MGRGRNRSSASRRMTMPNKDDKVAAALTSSRETSWLQSIVRYREGRAWATNAMLCVLGVGLLLFTRQFVAEHDHYTIGYSGCSSSSIGLYAVAVMLVLTQP